MKDDLLTAGKCKSDWLDQQCDKVLEVLKDLSLKDRLRVIEQVQDYLRNEEADNAVKIENKAEQDVTFTEQRSIQSILEV